MSVSDKSRSSDRNGSGGGYGLLINNHSAFPFEDSFFSSGTTTGGGGGGSSSRTAESTSSGGGRKTKVMMRHKASGVNIMCRKVNSDRRRGGSGGGGGHPLSENSNASHAGLLDGGGSSYVSKRSSGQSSRGAMDVMDRRDALTWKTTKTTTNSSLASSGNRSRMSRNMGRETGAFPSMDEFDFVEVDDIRRRKLGKTFGGCVGYKKGKNTSERDRMDYGGKSDVPPTTPGSPQIFKFHNALPSYRVQNTDFPQIIFANETPSENDDYFANGDFGDDNGFNRQDSDFRQSAVKNRGFDDILTSPEFLERSYSTERRDPFLPIENFRTRSPSPVRRSNRKSFDFSNASPRSRGSRSRSRAGSRGSRNPSPRSTRSLKEEEQFLDNLANALTAYNSFQKQKDGHGHNQPQQSSNRSVLNRLMEEVQVPHIPEFVDVQNESFDDYDDVSDVGMASTSGQRKDDSEDELVNPTKLDYHHPRNYREKRDYFDPSINQNQGEKQNDRVAKKLIDADERSLKWRLREADKHSHLFVRTNSLQRNPSVEMMETGRSLMDQDVSGSTTDAGRQDEDVDPTYAFGGSGVRKPPLALSEGFEDFGIDDRIYSRKHRPGDTFDDDDYDDDDRDGRSSNHRFFENESGRKSQISTRETNEYNDSRSRATSRLREYDQKRQANLMNKYITNYEANQQRGDTIEDQNDRASNQEELNDISAKSRSQNGPRSSKYREINGGAFFSESGSTISMQTSKWSNTNTAVDYGRKSMGMPVIKDDFDEIKGNRRHSPQSIAEFDQW